MENKNFKIDLVGVEEAISDRSPSLPIGIHDDVVVLDDFATVVANLVVVVDIADVDVVALDE
jgi:hypothetical protein